MKVLKFYADWCEPCKMLTRTIKDAGDKITLPIEEVNVDNDEELTLKYGIRGIPTMIIIDDEGEIVKRFIGMMMEDKLLEFLTV